MKQQEILNHFRIEKEVLSVEKYGSGHINQTFLVTVKENKKYILQKINTSIFPNVEELMENILQVTSFLREEIVREGGDSERETMTVILTKEGNPYYTDEDGNAWRVYVFIEEAISYNQVERKEDFYQSGVAVGRFQALLTGFPAEKLHEIIPDFHNTAKRYQDFEKAVAKDCCQRAAKVEAEIAFVRAHKEEMSILGEMFKKGELPLRVTHNDTKLNNILIDVNTKKAICMIDLDTVMPGLSVYDFGDAIRFGANTAAEDETDTEKVSLSLELYQAYLQGFLEGCDGRLTSKEMEMLPMGAKIMTLECGMRFLTDYLQGDTYFKVHREGHNLDRCRTQFALVEDMERKWNQMCDVDNIISLC